MQSLKLLFIVLMYQNGNARGHQMSENEGTPVKQKRPNIIVIIADDMGWNDVGFHGSNEIPTPNIDALGYNGVILNSHYTQALCTPSRAAFLTGKYPIHLGMQHLVILEPEPWGLPLNETILPQRLKQNGYKTHAIGKWHLGFFKKTYTPTYRGFDSHFGYWQGMQDYYDHTVHATFTTEFGYDMRRNMSVDWDSRGKYSTTLFTQEAVKIIHEHNTQDPMFMYLAHLAPHSGNDEQPLQAPDEEIAKFSYIQDPNRRVYAAMVSMLDRSVGEVITALREKHMLENSIILFISDNGAKSNGIHANFGSNYPLRGLKNSPWEGGMRCVAAIWSPLIKKPQRVSNEMMHISDWLPTIYSAAGLNADELGKDIDGKNMWQTISEGVPSPRTDFVYNIDDVWNYAAIRQGDWKYVYRTTIMKPDDWYGASGNHSNYIYTEKQILTSQTGVALNALNTYRQIAEGPTSHTRLLTNLKIKQLRDEATLKCKPLAKDEEQLPGTKCDPLISPCLFNIREDPCERINLATYRPLMLVNLEAALMVIRGTVRKPINIPRDPNADPLNWNGTWTNWQDYDIDERQVFEKLLNPVNIILLLVGLLTIFIILAIIVVLTKFKYLKNRKVDKRNCNYASSNVEEPENLPVA